MHNVDQTPWLNSYNVPHTQKLTYSGELWEAIREAHAKTWDIITRTHK